MTNPALDVVLLSVLCLYLGWYARIYYDVWLRARALRKQQKDARRFWASLKDREFVMTPRMKQAVENHRRMMSEKITPREVEAE